MREDKQVKDLDDVLKIIRANEDMQLNQTALSIQVVAGACPAKNVSSVVKPDTSLRTALLSLMSDT